MLDKDFVVDKVIELLPIDSDLYRGQVDILVISAMSKLKDEGIDHAKLEETDIRALDYCVCVSYQVAMDMDIDMDHARLMQQYITRVNTLRTSLL